MKLQAGLNPGLFVAKHVEPASKVVSSRRLLISARVWWIASSAAGWEEVRNRKEYRC